MKSYRRRIDKNQPEIIKALEAAGATVCDLSEAGEGVPDILIGFTRPCSGERINILAEIKQEPGKGVHKILTSLRPSQVEWHSKWKGQVATVRTVEEALSLLTD